MSLNEALGSRHLTDQPAGQRMRWLSEAVVIVASVFLAIFLEGLADDASRAGDADRSLAQLLSQLRLDSADLGEVREQQLGLGADYENLLRWLRTPESMPNDSVHEALERLAFLNKTMYPRKGAWEAITSTGQLAWVGDQELVTRLANLYGSQLDKLELMGQDYDFTVNEFSRVVMSQAWDVEEKRLVSGRTAGPHEMRGQLWYLRKSWNTYYLDLIDEYSDEVARLIPDLEAYLERR